MYRPVQAPMYFKKAIDDATSDWAQHHAKRIIDTKAKVEGIGRLAEWGFACWALVFWLAGSQALLDCGCAASRARGADTAANAAP